MKLDLCFKMPKEIKNRFEILLAENKNLKICS